MTRNLIGYIAVGFVSPPLNGKTLLKHKVRADGSMRNLLPIPQHVVAKAVFVPGIMSAWGFCAALAYLTNG